MQPNRIGKQTSEYKVTLFTIIVALISALAPILQAAISVAPQNSLFALIGGGVVAVASAIVGGTYNISRGLAKQPVPPEQQNQLILKEAKKLALQNGEAWIKQELSRRLTGGSVLGATLSGAVESYLDDEEDLEYEQGIESLVAQTVQAQEARYVGN